MSPNLKDPQLEKAKEILRLEFSAFRIYLFGSRVTGTATKESDYDFAIVTRKSRRPRYEKIEQVKSQLRSLGIQADIFVYTQKVFKNWEDEFNSIPELAKNTGIEL